MSAIAGRIELERLSDDAAGEARADAAIVGAMLERMRRRAPGARVEAVPGGALGWRGVELGDGKRLREPFVVADARIDNREEILDACAVPADERARASDRELIVMAYRRWGAGCARHLRGDFAFVLWDAARRELHAARDALGVRMLYYAWDGRVFRFATEPAALFADSALTLEPNDHAIALYVADLYFENGETLYRGVEALPAGHCLSLGPAGLRLARYWQLDPYRQLPRMGDEDYARLLRDELSNSVRNRLRGEERVGAQISGGMDSSAVAVAIERLRRTSGAPAEPPVLFHLVFPGLKCDESRYGRALAEHMGLPLVSIDAMARPDLTGTARAAAIPDVLYHPGGYIWSAILEAARDRGLGVVTTGEGGDLCLGMSELEAVHALTRGRLREVRRLAFSPRPFAPSTWRRAYHLTLRQLIPWRMRRALRPFRPSRHPVLAPRWSAAVSDQWMAQRLSYERRSFPDPVQRWFCECIEGSWQQLNLVYYDRLGGAHGVRMVHPFLDSKLVELLLAMPHEQRHVPGALKPKPVLHRAMRDLLPAAVYRRSDAAEFSSFVLATAFGRHRSELDGLFASSRVAARGIAGPNPLPAFSKTSDRRLLRCILNLAAMELWLRQVNP